MDEIEKLLKMTRPAGQKIAINETGRGAKPWATYVLGKNPSFPNGGANFTQHIGYGATLEESVKAARTCIKSGDFFSDGSEPETEPEEPWGDI